MSELCRVERATREGWCAPSLGGFGEGSILGPRSALGDALDPDTMATFAARYGAQVDFERTFPIVERHGLKF